MQTVNRNGGTEDPRDESMADPAPGPSSDGNELKGMSPLEEKRIDGDEMADAQPVASGSGAASANGTAANGASPNGASANGAKLHEKMVDEDKPVRSKKKARLHWDEENLTLNALEMERTPRMKIDEPKTPYVHGAGSEAGSSTSGSAPHSPGSPAVAFIPQERLQGFESLEDNIGGANGRANSGSNSTRSVQIVEDVVRSNGSSPRSSSDFAAKRKRHYANEARLSNFVSSDSSRSPRESPTVEAPTTNIESATNGTTGNGVTPGAADKMGNGL